MILLDTHILVWSVTDDTRRLPGSVMDAIDAAMAKREASVSAATFWELALKRRMFRDILPSLPPPADLHTAVLGAGLVEIPVSGSLWIEAVELTDDRFHTDPADQLIVATAIRFGHELFTRDDRILSWARRTQRVELYDDGAG